MLREGWMKDQMQKVAEEVKNWPDWMVKLDQTESKMENSLGKKINRFSAANSGSKQTGTVDPR